MFAITVLGGMGSIGGTLVAAVLLGVAESLDWARALHHLGTTDLDLESASRTLGALVKYREDAERLRAFGIDQLVEAAREYAREEGYHFMGPVRVELRGANTSGGRECLIAGVAELVGTAAAVTAAASK